MSTKTEVDERAPVVLVLSEPELLLTDLIKEVYRKVGYRVINLDLDDNFFNNCQQLITGGSVFTPHKIVLIYGLRSCVEEYYLQALKLLSQWQAPLVLVSFLPTNIAFLAEQNPVADAFYEKRIVFLKKIRNLYKDALVFVGQDLVVSGRFTSYPLLYLFSYLHQKQIVDLQNTIYIQDEKSFIGFIEPYLLKPHFAGSYLVRGKKQTALKVAKEIAYLYEQYFQQQVSFLKIITTVENTLFLREFVTITNVRASYVEVIDQKVRNLTELIKAEQSQLSLEEVQRLAIRQQVTLTKTSQTPSKPQKQPRKPLLMDFIGLFRKTEKQLIEPPTNETIHEQLTQKVESIFSTQRQLEKDIRQENNLVAGQEITKKAKKRKWLFWLGATFSGLGLLFLILITLFNFSQEYLQQQLYLAVKNDIREVKKIDESIIFSIFTTQYNFYQQILLAENLTTAADIKQLNTVLLGLVEAKDNLVKQSFSLYQQTASGGVELTHSYVALEQALDQKIEAEKNLNSYLMGLNLELFADGERQVWSAKLEENKQNLQRSLKQKRFLVAFKDVVLSEGRTTLALLVQDSDELRGTGGVVTEVMLLSMEKGMVVDQQIFSAADLNQRVYGKRAASEEMRKVLEGNTLQLSDVGWGGDFEQAAVDLSWFVGQATGQKVDLVIGVNSQLIQELTSVFDGLKLRDGRTLQASEYLVNKKTNQDTYSEQVAQLIFDQLLVLQSAQLEEVYEVLSVALENQEAFMYATDPALNQVLTANSWTGRQLENVCPAEFNQDDCQRDYLFQVENNAGKNKVGEYVSRVISHDIGVTPEFVRHKRKISWQNHAPSSLWPLGDYRFLFKLVLPKTTTVEKIELNQTVLAVEEYFVNETTQGKELSLLLKLGVGDRLDLVLTYLVPNAKQAAFTYVFTDYKQAGGLQKQTSYNLVFADTITPRLVAPVATFENKTIRFANNNLRNFIFAVDFVDPQQAK